VELRHLRLEHTRNYIELDVPFASGTYVFSGANAQGKTNLLEAVYLAATGHSPRTSHEGDLLMWGEDVARVVAEFVSPVRGPVTIEVALGRKPGSDDGRGGVVKRLKVNGVPRQMTALAGLVPVVLFLIEDLEIIRGEPACRRAFLDTELSAISRTYAWAFRQYTRVLEQRNRLLKEIRDGRADREQLAPWSAQLAGFGARLLEVRLRFIADLSHETQTAYAGLTASTQGLTLAYRHDGGELPSHREALGCYLTEALATVEGEEIRRGTSLVGPHRDDLHLCVDGKDVRQFGSQGEQRTAALALRVAECTLLERLLGEPPVLLLDDILSELDRTRRHALLAFLTPMTQVILTTTDVDALGLPTRPEVTRYQVHAGQLELLTE
jgi:DNA replication and repair protein RecF